jgi:DNA-binding NarL/FixJ family response regulator
VTVVIGVDGSGRTHRLAEIAARTGGAVVRLAAAAGLPADLAERLDAARAAGSLVVVDDVHRLDADSLRTLTAAAHAGLALAIGRRPTIDRPELAALDEIVASTGVEHLGPLDRTAIGVLINRATGRPPSPDTVAAVEAASAGLAAVAAAIAGSTPGEPSPALLARVHRRLALLDAATAGLARVLALRLDLPDEVLAAAAGLKAPELPRGLRALRDEGLLVPADDRMVPAVAEAVLADLAPTELRRTHEAVADALVDAGADPATTAGQLRAARARTAKAAGAYLAAGDQLRFTEPAAAIGWYDEAIDAGADPSQVAAGRTEAGALLGLPPDIDAGAGPAADRLRLTLVDGALAAYEGRAARAADTLLTAGPLGHLLAVPALVATGRLPTDPPAAGAPPATGRIPTGPASLRRLAEAALAIPDPAAALPLFIEAAEAVERRPPPVVLPDTPHALGALVATTAGDAATAQHLLGRALAQQTGGPVAAERHRLLLAWVRMRAGRYDTAVAELRGYGASWAALPGRERLLHAAVAAGIARRSGDIAKIRDSWASVEQVLARRAIDLFHLEPLEELAVAAARLRQQHRIEPVLSTVDDIVAGLGNPPAWLITAGWVRLQLAIVAEDATMVSDIAARLGGVRLGDGGPSDARQRAQRDAAAHWARVFAGDVDPDGVLEAADRLAAAELPWEGSRLTGQAAIRTTDASAARRLLEHAREMSNPDGPEPAARQHGTDPRLASLSEREVEVARLVLAGATHRDIGGQLYISPKTVEHHVARIRTKLGASTRAEFIAALRELLDSG